MTYQISTVPWAVLCSQKIFSGVLCHVVMRENTWALEQTIWCLLDLNLKPKSKRVYLQSALGHINANGRGKAVLRRSQAVFKCFPWWGIDSFVAEGIPVKHSTSKKWIFGSVMTRPGSSNFLSWSCRMSLSGRGAKRLLRMATRPCLIL